MSRTIDRDALFTACLDADVETSAVYDSYSGRFMYGARCFGLVVQSRNEVTKVMLQLQRARALSPEEIDQLVEDMRADQLGKRTIFYFPGWELAS
jgi:hypothetical protein